MAQTYDAHSIQKLSFVEGVRKRVGIYLGSADMSGVIAGLLELVNNSTDEFLVYPAANEIEIEVGSNWASCRDKGRGFPRGPNPFSKEIMIDLLTENHSGAKFDELAYGGKSRGLNGSGGSATCCSSDWFEIESRRDGYVWSMRFEKGVPLTPTAQRGSKTTKTGTYIKYQPSQEVFSSEPIFFNYDAVCAIIEEYAYFNKGITFKVINAETREKRTFFSKNGLMDFAKAKIRNPIHSDPIYNKFSVDSTDVEIIAYWTKETERFYLFSNGGENPNGGTPITGARTAITRNINKMMGKNPLTGDMVRTGLTYIISVQLKNPIYDGQTKTRITNPELRSMLDRAFSEALDSFKDQHADQMQSILQFLTKEKKADEAAQRAREAVLNATKEILTTQRKKVFASDKLQDAIELGQNSTLILSEGNSAASTIRSARDPANYGILALRGKIINALTNPLDKVLENEEVRLIMSALGITPSQYNEKNLRYGKVAIACDGDADGGSITNLIIALFYVLFPQFLQQGRLYKFHAPLYKVMKGKENHYFFNEEEMMRSTISGGIRERYKGLGSLSAEDAKQAFFNTKLRRLDQLVWDENAASTIEDLLGTDVAPRKEFVYNEIDFNLYGGMD